MPSPYERLSRSQREATPPAFAAYLLGLVRSELATTRVAVLWTQRRSVYWRFWPEVELWGRGRDANKYPGPYPVICHPPCGPWGKFKRRCRQPRADAINAIRLVHLFGGVVEHPLGSELFRLHGRGGTIIQVRQRDYGHPAPKPTLLYLVTKPERTA